VRGSDGWSEATSDSKSITPPSYITNNLLFVASLLFSPFILSLFAIRFAHRRFVWLMIVLTPFLGENGGSPPTVESVAVCRSLLTGCTEGGLVGGKNLAPILEGYLEGMEVETLYLKVGAWLVVDCGLKDHTSILVDAYKIAVKYGTPETVASLLHLAATSLRKGASQEELASGLSNMVMSSTQNTFNKLPTTNPKVYKASLEIVQAAGGNFAVCGIGR